ncbi:MAG TPA: DUF3014 domain-containing protein [Anaeromyxobacter sp.]|nr:DUF3014 domain-containing protein [Anaeromyxobacter sp.]
MDDLDPGRKQRRPLSKGEWAAVVLAVVVVASAIWVWLRKPAAPPPPPAQPTAEAAAPQAPAAEAPAAAVSPAQARTSLASVSTNATFQRWLAGVDDVVARWAVVTDNLAEGVSPRKALEIVGPKQPFKVAQRAGKTLIAAESYARYDEVADVVASVDAKAFAGVYRGLHGALQAAYRALGFPSGSIDGATLRALHRLEGAPVAQGDVELTPDRGVYLFADPKWEQLREVEKHLLRMGPRNTRLIQAKAREIEQALALPAEAAATK